MDRQAEEDWQKRHAKFSYHSDRHGRTLYDGDEDEDHYGYVNGGVEENDLMGGARRKSKRSKKA